MIMDKKKLLFIYIAPVLTLALTVSAMMFGVNMHVSGLASLDVAEMTSEVVSENELLNTRRSILQSEVGSKTDDTDRKNELNKQITEITGEISTMKTDITAAEKSAAELKSKTAAVQKTLTDLKNGMNPKKGRSTEVGESGVMCPYDISIGRYIATGDGILTIIAATGSARVSEDLLSIDTGSYTFDLADGEIVEATGGSVTLTELK